MHLASFRATNHFDISTSISVVIASMHLVRPLSRRSAERHVIDKECSGKCVITVFLVPWSAQPKSNADFYDFI